MNDSMFVSLIQNTALLLGLVFLFDLTALRWQARRPSWWQVPFGILIGGIGIVIMLTPWVYVPGIVFDTRSILLGVSGIFFGAVPTLIAMGMTAALRIILGGQATVTGVSVILITGALGIAFRHYRKQPLVSIRWQELYLFGLIIHLFMLACMLLLPWETAKQVLSVITLPVLIIYPLGTAALGSLLTTRLRRELVSEELRDSEERLRLAVGASNIGFFDRDVRTNQVHFSAEWKRQIGYKEDEISNSSFEWESRLHPDDFERVMIIENDFVNGRRNDYEAQYRLRHKDGSYRWILARGERQIDAEGKPLRVLGCHIDITEQILAQAAITASERRFRGLAESSQDYIMLFDQQCRHIYVNPAAQQISGLSLADLIGKTHREAGFSEELCEMWETDIKHVFETGAPTQRLFEWESVNGKAFLDLRLAPMFNSQGEVDLVLGISRDITALKQAEQALKKSEELHRVLTENIQDVVWVLDSKSLYFTYVSPSVEHLRGYTAQEVMSLPVQNAMTEEAGNYLIDLIRQRASDYLSGKEPPSRYYSDEVEQPCKDGSTIWTDVRTNYYTNPENGHVEVRGVTRDISARKQVELQREAALLALSKSEAEYRSLFANMRNGFAYCRMLYEGSTPVDFIYLDVNRAFTQLTGLKDAVGKKVSELIPGIQKTDPELIEIYGRVAQTGNSESFEIYVQSLQDWYSLSVYCPEKDHFVAIFDVITARKKIEENLLQTQAELQHQLAASDQSRLVLLSMVEDQRKAEEHIRILNTELEARVRLRTSQLESANKELEAFAYSVSHDLRAPLRAMDGFSEALLADYQDRLDEQGKHFLQRIQDASQRMGQLINDLLNLSRITRTQLNRQKVNLSEIALAIASELHSSEPSRNVEFDITPQIIVDGDPQLLRIVLDNLLSNAYKFTSKRDHTKISLGMIHQAGEKVYFVQDNGAGFNMAYASKLFAPFQRLHASDEYPGTGIGLVTVQRIISRHGGRIWPEAEEDKGATLYFTLGGAE